MPNDRFVFLIFIFEQFSHIFILNFRNLVASLLCWMRHGMFQSISVTQLIKKSLLLLVFIKKKISLTTNFLLFCSMFPRSTHETFSQKLYQTFKSHKRFSKPKLSPTDFTIYHYAGDVSMSSSTPCNLLFNILFSFLFLSLLNVRYREYGRTIWFCLFKKNGKSTLVSPIYFLEEFMISGHISN